MYLTVEGGSLPMKVHLRRFGGRVASEPKRGQGQETPRYLSAPFQLYLEETNLNVLLD